MTTAHPISDELKAEIVAKVKSDTGMENIELESLINEELIGGFKLEIGGNLVDATILRDLKDVRKQFSENIYVHKIR
jgi:F-type H+-transporting ATPase subunit delta